MDVVKRILDTTKSPQLISTDFEHTYDDKFATQELMTNMALTSISNTLDALQPKENSISDDSTGWLKNVLGKARDQKKFPTLRLNVKTSALFLKEEVKEVEAPETTQETKQNGSLVSITTRRVFNKVKHFYWKYDFHYELYAFVGNKSNADDESSYMIRKGTISRDFVQKGTKTQPRTPQVARNP